MEDAIHLTEAEDAIDIGRGAPVLLSSGAHVWRVEGGAAEVYFDTPEGRRLIALAPEGGYVAAAHPEAGGLYAAVGEAGTRLVAGALTPDAADAWARAVAAGLRPPRSDDAPAPASVGDQIGPGLWRAATRDRVVWLVGDDLRWHGRNDGASVLPMTGGLSIEATGATQAVDAATLEAAGRLDVALALLAVEIAGAARMLRANEDTRAFASLRDAPPSSDTASAAEAVAQAAAALNYTPRDRPHGGKGGFAEIPALLRLSGLRGRRVALAPGWTLRGSDVLIAENAETGEATTLIPGRRGYRLATGQAIGRDSEEAFARFTFAVHAPLPSSVNGLMSLARHVAPKLKRDALWIALAGAGASLIGAVTPLAAAWIFSDIVPAGLATLLVSVGLALLAGAFVSALFSSARALAMERIEGRTGLDIAAAVSDKVLRLPPQFFRDYAIGDLAQRIGAVDQLRGLVIDVMLSSGLTLIFSIFYFAVLISLDAKLAMLSIPLVLVYVIAAGIARALQLRHVRRAAELDGAVSGASYETLSAVAKLRVAAAEERALARWLKTYREERAANVSLARIGAHFGAFADAYQTITLMALFGVAALLTAQDAPAGLFIGFLVAFGSFQGAFIGFCDGLMSLFAAQPLVERARAIFEAEAETTETRVDPGRLTGAIELSGVSFSYPGGRPLLEGITLSLRPGEHVAIVGGSGSGKSTILRLLLGFEKADRGAITYDGRDLSRLDLGRVRSQIGVVMQSSQLFAGSILENVRGATDAGLEACMEAAEAAGLAPDLAGFPMGLHTPITEGGGALSGGQRQRVLIARALVGKPAMLFLDEATSALDNATQAVVIKALETSSATRIVIAHRLSTVRRADRICVLKDGRFAEIGTYDELMAQNGAFRALADRQLLET